ncbi:hypothetical protein Hypma_003889 [Hypsizygus marmoreus]|uniref:Uncharacterized protein n=1 Tax=Hypsizygus marmoreus TaxID=39966 RepID=A0A369K0S7_HYPMA|nr:hypothetical protein Hypma_003889 [Hypsizygus marmoreus]
MDVQEDQVSALMVVGMEMKKPKTSWSSMFGGRATPKPSYRPRESQDQAHHLTQTGAPAHSTAAHSHPANQPAARPDPGLDTALREGEDAAEDGKQWIQREQKVLTETSDGGSKKVRAGMGMWRCRMKFGEQVNHAHWHICRVLCVLHQDSQDSRITVCRLMWNLTSHRIPHCRPHHQHQCPLQYPQTCL